MYTALYRKWRPRKFEEVYGQEQATVTLKNELKNGKLSHAYLFCGTRGTGKTSTAKLLAKAVNCRQPEDHNPCDKCDSCISINEGNSIDVFEIDAASNRGIDDIRDLREAIKYTPTLGKYKVYIIDEVHMLTNEAFNALLKTLEEPPEYVLFILATTEPHKLPATILSRCQRFDFKRISVDNIIRRLDLICREENLEAEDTALRLIARNSDGAMRDALSILDQCAVYGAKRIQYEAVLEVLGIVNNEFLFKMADAVRSNDAGESIILINTLSAGGKDIHQFIRDLTLHYRNLLMTKVVAKAEDVIDLSREGVEQLKSQAEQYAKDNIIRCISILSELETEAKWSSNPRVLLEIAAVKMCRAAGDESMEGILARLEQLEQALVNGRFKVDEAGVKVKLDKSEQAKAAPQKAPAKTPAASRSESKAASDILHKWGGFVQELKSRGKIKLRTFIALAKPVHFEKGTLVISFSREDSFSKEAVEAQGIKHELEEVATAFFETSVKIKTIFEGERYDGNPDGDMADEGPGEDEIDIVAAAIHLVGKDKVEVMEEE